MGGILVQASFIVNKKFYMPIVTLKSHTDKINVMKLIEPALKV